VNISHSYTEHAGIVIELVDEDGLVEFELVGHRGLILRIDRSWRALDVGPSPLFLGHIHGVLTGGSFDLESVPPPQGVTFPRRITCMEG
jgi:hypothetical protein